MLKKDGKKKKVSSWCAATHCFGTTAVAFIGNFVVSQVEAPTIRQTLLWNHLSITSYVFMLLVQK
jgi:hypothetical protein